MELATQPQLLPELALIEDNKVVSESKQAADARAVETERAMISGLSSLFSAISSAANSEHAQLELILLSFGFGPMFSVI